MMREQFTAGEKEQFRSWIDSLIRERGYLLGATTDSIAQQSPISFWATLERIGEIDAILNQPRQARLFWWLSKQIRQRRSALAEQLKGE